MKLALLTPCFAPDLYYLAAMLQADRVVLQDMEKFSRKSSIHRARIRTPEGTQWINIPVRTEDRSKLVNQVRIDHSLDWITPLLRALNFNYRNSIYFDFYEPEITADFQRAADFEYLMDFNNYFRNRLFTFLYIEKEMELASDITEYNSDPDLFAQRIGADVIFQEYKSRHYQRQAERRKDPDFIHPVYRQHFDGFEPWCSVLDVLFQYGPTSFQVLDQLIQHNNNE
jgi:hypothetical protein